MEKKKMTGHRRALGLILILALSSVVTLQPAVCTTTKLATPEVSVRYIDCSYDSPAYSTIDPYTGQTIEVPSMHVENRTLQFTIKRSISTETGQLYYVIRMKGHFSENWTGIYKGWVNSSSPELTLWTFSTLRGQDLPGQSGYFYRGGESFFVPSEGQLDFQVKAETWGEVMATPSATDPFGGSRTTMFGESDWSSINTIDLVTGEAHVTPTVTPTATPTPTATAPPTECSTATPTQVITESTVAFELSWKDIALAAACTVIAVLAAALLLSHRGGTKKNA
ncbi:MAG: hypothetical protein NWE93_12895 [Candidatus Bathyarchaeota archaeon]|nr:hypothetical protein [Candidatus Bathyarchaeota archaeon]